MQETTNQAKPTPTRRRQGRGGGGKAAGQKMYASENDVADVSNLAYEHHGNPHTPQKSYSGSPEPQSGTGNQTGSKQRSRNKPRAKNPNTVASPDVTRHNRRSTPQNIPVNTKPTAAAAAAAAAFAGATFHASPAPSALPMPSFYSKSIPESPGPKRDAQQQPSPPPAHHERPTPQHPATVPRAQESPLDAIFRADRAEREKARRSSSLQSSMQPVGSESPAAPSPKDGYNSPFVAKPYNTHPGHRMSLQRSSSGISVAELDGHSGKPLGPAFSTPYQERIRAARGAPNQSPNGARTSQPPPIEDRSEALKKYLFGAKGSASSAQPSASGPPAQYVHNGFMGSTPESQSGHSADLRAMEDNLRRILKLESPLATAKSGDRPLYS
ncbi:hypothetical protein CGRA01v4_07099 [Colletotrichum graminicola]|uniref:Proteophosphoglycan 5 n=1 Tax=Colletotrichum graminicola (strain M1.001 / M2 / FGSC 10212) TaxID=645133 RepID=E3QCS1_COLGM|nr:uncharacterized protein GLRG_03803 [Colletotrichum graminicola M1.001]EFQ28659.1 hypothetical protein GLRG_03803 [Colletotrichum graminicola M1.001]WDK15818.1 hypothetical protein CGRA01v4_07099 [Colletotrichum graminicola]